LSDDALARGSQARVTCGNGRVAIAHCKQA